MKRLINRLKGFDIKRMFKMINVVKNRSGHSFLWVFFDIFRCFILFGSGYMDYYLFYFEDLSDEEKATYINISVNKKYIREMNDPNFYYVLNDKVTFLNKYRNFIKRDFIDIRNCSYEDFVKFIKKHKEFMAKPIDGFCGYGIELVKIEKQDPKELYESLINKHQYLLEEKIIQNKEVSKIYPHAINTLRIVTINKNDKVDIMFSCIRIGNLGRVVDNFNNGGLIVPINDDGTITKVALDKNNVAYESHPMTNTPIVGFKIPHYKEAIELCKKLAKVTPELGLCGWDIAITEKGLDVVEGNQIPGYDIYQSREHIAPSRLGIKEKFDNAIYPENKDKIVFAKGFNIYKLIVIVGIFCLIDALHIVVFTRITLFGLLTAFNYLFLYRNIDKRALWKTCLIASLIGLLVVGVEFIYTVYGLTQINNFDFLELIREGYSTIIIYLLIYMIGMSIGAILYNYFIFPLNDRFIESINPKIGKALCIVMALYTVLFTGILIFILILMFSMM